MPPGAYTGLGALGSILAGIGSGTVRADQLGQQQRALDLQERGQNLLAADRSVDLDALAKVTGLNLGTGRLPTATADAALKVVEARRVQQAEQARRQEAAAALEASGH